MEVELDDLPSLQLAVPIYSMTEYGLFLKTTDKKPTFRKPPSQNPAWTIKGLI